MPIGITSHVHLGSNQNHGGAHFRMQEFGAPQATVELHKYILPQLHSTAVRTVVQR